MESGDAGTKPDLIEFALLQASMSLSVKCNYLTGRHQDEMSTGPEALY